MPTLDYGVRENCVILLMQCNVLVFRRTSEERELEAKARPRNAV